MPLWLRRSSAPMIPFHSVASTHVRGQAGYTRDVSPRTYAGAFVPYVGLLIALLLLAACAPVTQSGASLPEGVVRGEVTFPDLRPLPSDAAVEVQIIDTSVSGYPANVFASTTIQASGLRPPIAYQLVFDPAAVKPDVTYLVGARVYSGDDLLYVSQTGDSLFGAGSDLGNVEIAASALPEQAAAPGQMNGTLTWLTRDVLPNNASIAVQLVDRTERPYQRVAESVFRSEGAQTPISFLISYDPDKIDTARTYAIEARISVDGRLAWLSEQPVAVLTKNAPADNVEVPLRRVSSETAATAGNVVVANLVFPAGDVLPIGSTVMVEIIDQDQDAVVASTELHGEGLQSPLAVELALDFTPSELRSYVLRARIAGPEAMLYMDEAELPVLTQGAPVTNIAVPLVALQTPVVFATSAATPIAVPTAVTVSGDAPAPALAPAFPGGASTAAGTLDLSGVITGGVTITIEPADVELGAGVLDQVSVLLAMLVEGEPVVLGQSDPLDAILLDEALPFALAYEPSLIDPATAYVVYAQVLDLDGALVAESDAVPVFTNDAPLTDVQLVLVVNAEAAMASIDNPAAEETPVAEATVPPEATPTPAAEGESDTATSSDAVIGSVQYDERIALPAGAVISVQLLDLSTTPFRVVTEDRMITAGEQPPFDYSLSLGDVDDAKLGAYAIAATITSEGETLWSAPGLTPLLASGSLRTLVDLTLQAGVNGGSAMPNDGVEARPVSSETDEEANTTEDASGESAGVGNAATTATLGNLADNVVGVIVRFTDAELQTSGTQVRVELRNVGEGAIVAESTVDASTQDEPILVRLPYAPGEVSETGDYRIFVTVLQDGSPVGFTGRGTPVLTNGAPNAVEVQLP